MAKCTYFFDKVTNSIVGSHAHAEKAPNGTIVLADSDLSEVWEDIRAGVMWPHILEKVTDQDPDNLDFIVAENMPHGYNEYHPARLTGKVALKRRPYFCLKVVSNLRLKKEKEHEKFRMYEVETEGGITLDMEVSVRTTQNTIEDHEKDKEVKNISGEFLAECTYGTLIPRDGVISMRNGMAQFQWALPDSTMNAPARCYVKDPSGEILISKSLRVKCC